MPIREQQTTNKQHAIPQSIMSVEFKIIGDLTIKQFVFLMIFCGAGYASFMLISAFVVKWLFVIFFVVTGICFAFLPLGDRGLDAWVVNFFRAMFMPNQFVYRKDEEVPNVFSYQNLDVLKSELITLTPTSSRRKIEAYLEQQEKPEDRLDIDEEKFVLKVKSAYSSEYLDYTNPQAPSGPIVSTASVYPAYTSKQQTTKPAQEIPSTVSTPVEENKAKDINISPTPSMQEPQTINGYTIPAQGVPTIKQITQLPQLSDIPVKPRVPESLDIPLTPSPAPTEPITVTSIQLPVDTTPPNQPKQAETTALVFKPPEPGPVNEPKVVITPPTKSEPVVQTATSAMPQNPPSPIQQDQQILKGHSGYTHLKHRKSPRQDTYYSPSMTPDMHSGRRFINLSQEAARGEIILPIRGEKVLSLEEDTRFESEEAQKVKELDNLITQVKSGEMMQRQIIQSRKIQEAEDEKRRKLEEAQSQKQDMKVEAENQIKIAENRRMAEEQRRKILEAEQEAQRLREKEEEIRKQKELIIKKQREEEEAKQKIIQTEGIQLPPRPQINTIPLQPAQSTEAPTVPNVIWGIVTTEYENKKVPVPGVVVLIRNQKKEVVRAVNSNAQGKFSITTPLINGSYTIEVDKEKKSGLNFPVTQVEAAGKIIPVMEVTGQV